MYVIIMRRFGDEDKHSYLLGCWPEKEKAVGLARKEFEHRGHKYIPQLHITDDDGKVIKREMLR